MDSMLPATGTAELLELHSPFVPDDCINRAWRSTRTGGRRRQQPVLLLSVIDLLDRDLIAQNEITLSDDLVAVNLAA